MGAKPNKLAVFCSVILGIRRKETEKRIAKVLIPSYKAREESYLKYQTQFSLFHLKMGILALAKGIMFMIL